MRKALQRILKFHWRHPRPAHKELPSPARSDRRTYHDARDLLAQ
jgi:hypothetical protein